MTGAIQTNARDTKTCEFRTLHFSNLGEVRREVERIAASERAGTLRAAGNWTAGQTFNHMAAWIGYAYDGYPPELRPPWIIKMILKMQRNKFLYKPMPRGVRIPKLKNGTMATEPTTLEAGLAKLLTELARLEQGPPPHENPIFGRMTHEEWKTGHLRHAELHLGYLHPGG